MRNDRFEGTWIEETGKSIGSGIIEVDDRSTLRNKLAVARVAKRELDLRILDNEADGVAGKFDVGRDGNEARTHDGKIGDQDFGAIERENGDPVTALQVTAGERSRARLCLLVEITVR